MIQLYPSHCRGIQRPNKTTVITVVVVMVFTLLLSWFWYLSVLIQNDFVQHHGHGTIQYRHSHNNNNHQMQDAWVASSRMKTTTSINPFCQFRRYPWHRYYQLPQLPISTQQEPPLPHPPDFLTSTSHVEYIYGVWPTILEQGKHFVAQDVRKLCVNQTEWWGPTQQPVPTTKSTKGTPTTTVTWPFADGTNPSVLLMHRIQEQASHVANRILQHFPTTYYVVTVCMTNSQCTWNDAESDPTIFDLPDRSQKQPDTVRTILQLLDIHFHKIMETTIYLSRDAAWGKKLKGIDDHTSPDYTYLPALDDARLFVYQSQIYVSYREGPGFGYDVQVLNPIHIDIESEMIATHHHTKMTKSHIVSATIKASESASFCCGRNMALMPDFGFVPHQHDPHTKLHALTWVDPVTVEAVDATPIHQRTPQQQQKQRRLLLDTTNSTLSLPPSVHQYHNHRRLKEEKHKSHIHGTNAFMVPIPTMSKKKDAPTVYLGIAHFHRPNDRKPNEYARFGHHYTHAFYTISTDAPNHKSGTATNTISTFHLTALSPEFVIRSTHIPEDAEIIQFISGLEYDPTTNQIILSYGINDCEGAIRRMDYRILQKLLRPVPRGKQVVDFMLPLQQ